MELSRTALRTSTIANTQAALLSIEGDFAGVPNLGELHTRANAGLWKPCVREGQYINMHDHHRAAGSRSAEPRIAYLAFSVLCILREKALATTSHNLDQWLASAHSAVCASVTCAIQTVLARDWLPRGWNRDAAMPAVSRNWARTPLSRGLAVRSRSCWTKSTHTRPVAVRDR